MLILTPGDALGREAADVRDLLIEVARSRHDRAAAAHLESGSRYWMGFASQWRDLLDDAREALIDRGFQSHKLAPAGYELPVVNDCLLYVWRVPGTADAVSRFASSPTRKNGFAAKPPDPMLFGPGFDGDSQQGDQASDKEEDAKVERLVRAVGDTMPLVLIMVHSSPRQLQSIEWAIAELDGSTGDVALRGHEVIWEPDTGVDGATSEVESFDSGTPVVPTVELLERKSTAPDE